MDTDECWYYDGTVSVLNSTFTIGIWLRFKEGLNDIANKIYIRFADSSDHTTNLASSMTDTSSNTFDLDLADFNYYKIQRNASNVVTISINNHIIDSFTNSATLDFSSDNSIIFIGNEDVVDSLGFTPIVDDMIISNELLSGLPSSDYITSYRLAPNDDGGQVTIQNVLRIY